LLDFGKRPDICDPMRIEGRGLGSLSRWFKVLQLLLPIILIGIGVLHAVSTLIGSGFDAAINQFLYPFIFVTSGLVLSDFNRRRKDLN